MKFLIIGWNNKTEISGGLDIHIHKIAENLAKKGHKITMFLQETKQTKPSTDNPDNNYNDTNYNNNRNYILIPTTQEPKNNTEILEITKNYNNQIINHTKTIDFDVILSHDWIGINAANKIKKSTNTLWIHTVHSLEYMRSLTEINNKNIKNEIEIQEKKGIINADLIFTVSNFMKNKIKEKYNKNSIVIYNGPTFNKNKYNQTEIIKNTINKTPTTPTILYIGRLTAQKGIEYLILSSKTIIKKYPNVKFLIAGKGELKESLENFAKALGVSNNFNFLGFVSNEKLIELYTTASVFVSPSIYEPFGITTIDAAIFECPIITTKNTGANEILPKNLITIIEPQNSKSLSDAIINVLENPKTQRTNAKKLKKQIEKTDFWNNATDILIDKINNNQRKTKNTTKTLILTKSTKKTPINPAKYIKFKIKI